MITAIKQAVRCEIEPCETLTNSKIAFSESWRYNYQYVSLVWYMNFIIAFSTNDFVNYYKLRKLEIDFRWIIIESNNLNKYYKKLNYAEEAKGRKVRNLYFG